jgi:hypothetical protein
MIEEETNNPIPLPTIDVPVYTVKLPSSGVELKVRPFNVKEEKLLFLAVEANNSEDLVNTAKQVIANCIIKGSVDFEKTPFFDIDFLFIFLRAKSVGEKIEIDMTCNNTLDNGNRCGHRFETQMDISNCEIVRAEEGLSDNIKLDKERGVVMKYPSYSIIKHIDSVAKNDIDKKTAIIINSIDHIYDKKGVYSSKDYSSKQLKEFVESLTEDNYKKLEVFVDNFPTFVVRIEADCPACGFHHVVRYTDFLDFFTS